MKTRLDLLLLEKKLFESRQKAAAVIMSGNVYINGQKCDKAGQMVDENANIEIKSTPRFVSRGGCKLLCAIERFDIDLNGLSCIDIGASTGGFCDCMLQFGAKKVYCVDVGYGQLAWKLRTDKRVVNIERTNARYLDLSLISDLIDFGTIDVSFISLKLVLPVLYNILKPHGRGVCLIKPQFEAGRGRVGKNGVVTDPLVHISVLKTVLDFAQAKKFNILGLCYSPIKGPKGNIEYLMYIEKSTSAGQTHDFDIEKTVALSHKNLTTAK